MRKQYLAWMIAVFGVVGTAYGAYSLIYNFTHDKDMPIYGLILLILGILALALVFVLLLLTYFGQKKQKNEPVPPVEDKKMKEETVEPFQEEAKPEPKPERKEYVPKSERTHVSYSSYSTSTVYVKQVGFGPLLRIDGNRILDMRNNIYYRIENNMVKQEGYGPIFEIRGNQIKNAFGGYLYELSGSNINKVFGGFYASISGNYITLFDLSVKYEMTDSLSRNQILAVAALLFESY